MERMRFFNTEGPVRSADHYCIPPLERINLDIVLGLVRDKKYFVLHAPRQTGKTSALLALRDLLNGGGDYRCVYADFEVGQAAREDTARAMRALLGELARRARVTLDDQTPDALRGAALETEGADGALIDVLSRWAAADPRPLVLLIDEIDTLVGDTLVSVLRQLRAGCDQRPAAFPHSVILCGVVDVRDYRIRSTAANALVLGGSAFNVKSKSLRLGDFTEAEVRTLHPQPFCMLPYFACLVDDSAFPAPKLAALLDPPHWRRYSTCGDTALFVRKYLYLKLCLRSLFLVVNVLFSRAGCQYCRPRIHFDPIPFSASDGM